MLIGFRSLIPMSIATLPKKMGMTKNQILNREFVNGIMAESFEEKLWADLCALQNFQRNLIKAEIIGEEEITETNCVCRKCGEIVKCLHDEDEPHEESLCGECSK